ncbi:MAG: DmsC/YnfH family molybdoenzyme membrane anchor subunit [Pseudomonadota bacterium]
MNPALSVVFLTTLIGAGQGLFVAMYVAQAGGAMGALPVQDGVRFYALGSALSLLLLGGGLLASFFHLGHPERAWRAVAMWRTSWLSREVIALPAFMAAVFVYGALHYLGWNDNLFGAASPGGGWTYVAGGVGVLLCITLFVCTGMIYACIKFIEEWHTPFTLINFTLLGVASGFVLATGFSAFAAPALVKFFGAWAITLTLVALIFRAASLLRNKRIRHMSNLQTAIGVKHTKIQQKAQGAMGGSFNTREFFHGKSALFLRSVKWIFLVLTFVAPVPLLWLALSSGAAALFVLAHLVQFIGLIAERWFFFAQAKHPQNLYYQTIS